MQQKMRKEPSVRLAIVVLLILVVAIGASYFLFFFNSTPALTFQGTIQGAGATFPQPFYSKLSAEFLKLHPGIRINYNGIGSGGGIRQFMAKTVDFGASDAPMTDAQLANAPGALHIPMVIGGIVVAYYVPGIQTGLVLSGDVLAKIFLGQITNWNDPVIKALNPALQLPDHAITVVHRSDGSGTTFGWTQYLSALSSEWASKVGASTSVNWPVGLGGQGNAGVAGLLSPPDHPYSIGYVEYTYATLNNLTYAYIINAAGNVIKPNVDSFSAAVTAAAPSLPAGDESWANVSIINSVANNSKATNAYPITTFTYILIYKDLSAVPHMTRDKAQALVQFLWWAIHDGQQFATALEYVPLPSSVVSLDEATLRTVQFSGQTLLG